MRFFSIGFLSAVVLVSAAGGALAQGYPNKSILLVLCYGAGSNVDILSRLIGQRLTENLREQIVILNKPGGNTVIGTNVAAKATPDGYTLFMGQTGNMAIVPALYAQAGKKPPYDTMKDFDPVAMIGVNTSVLVVRAGLPVKSVAELIKLAKSKPDQLNYASSGSGGTTHLIMEMFKRMAGINMVHVPYVSSGPQMTAIVGGQVDLGITSMLAVGPHVKAGRMRALAVSGDERSPAAPEVPTLAEAGVPGFHAESWYGVLVPVGTPKKIVAQLNSAINKVAEAEATRLSAQGLVVRTATPEKFGAFVKQEYVKWAQVVKDSGAKVD